MGRRRIDLGSSAEAEIATRTARGESAETIAATFKGRVSHSTIARRMRELRDRGSPDGIKKTVAELVHLVGRERAIALIREFCASLTPPEQHALAQRILDPREPADVDASSAAAGRPR